MKKVGSTTDTADANGEYTNGNVANGVSPTIINAEMLNTFQRELVNVVEGAGIALDPNDDSQVLKSINKLIKTNNPALLEARGYQKLPSGLVIQWGVSIQITYLSIFSTQYPFRCQCFLYQLLRLLLVMVGFQLLVSQT